MPDFCSLDNLIFLLPRTSLIGWETAACGSSDASRRTTSVLPNLILGRAAVEVDRGRSVLAGVVVLESRSSDGILSLILGSGSSLGLMSTSHNFRRHHRISRCVEGALKVGDDVGKVRHSVRWLDKLDLQYDCHHGVAQHDAASDGVTKGLEH